MKGIMAQYNNAFGYLKGFIFMDFGFAALALIVLGIASPFTEIGVVGLIYVPVGLLILAGVVLLFLNTLKKCPEDHKNPVALALWMIIAGLLACFAFAWWFIKLVFRISASN